MVNITNFHTIEPFHVMELLRRAKELEQLGRDVVHMEIGEPDFDTPLRILEGAQHALRDSQIKYTQAGGLPQLRTAIAAHYLRRYGVQVNGERIFVTPGASGALLLALAAAMPRQARVLLADPGYPCYRNFIRVLGGVPVMVDIGRSNYQLSADIVASCWDADTAGLIFASPSNPTGMVMPKTVMAHLLNLIDDRGGFCISDEIYHGLEYEDCCHSALESSPRSFVINSFSKYFGMTGWRLGWIVVPEGYEEVAERLAQNLFISAPTLSQFAAMAAFDAETIEELEKRRKVFQTRRDFLYDALNRLGFKLPARPSGAFYIYADCSEFCDDSWRFCKRLLEQGNVAVTPGKDFGVIDAERHVRFTYTSPLDRLEEGIERIRRFIGG